MKSRNTLYCWSLFIIFLSSFFFSSCSLLHPGDALKKSLAVKVTKAWEAKKAGNWGEIYEISDNEFKRNNVKENFIAKCNLIVNTFEILTVEVDESGTEGLSKVKFETQKWGMTFTPTVIEKWILDDHQWRLYLSGTQKTPFTPNDKK